MWTGGGNQHWQADAARAGRLTVSWKWQHPQWNGTLASFCSVLFGQISFLLWVGTSVRVRVKVICLQVIGLKPEGDPYINCTAKVTRSAHPTMQLCSWTTEKWLKMQIDVSLSSIRGTLRFRCSTFLLRVVWIKCSFRTTARNCK